MTSQHKLSRVSYQYLLILLATYLLLFFINPNKILANPNLIKINITYAQANSNEAIAKIDITLPNDYYAYAPKNSAELEKNLAAKLDVYSQQPDNTLISITYPHGILRADLLEPNKQVAVYEHSLTIFLITPNQNPLPQAATLKLTLCSKQNCIPLTENLTLNWPDNLQPMPNSWDITSGFIAERFSTQNLTPLNSAAISSDQTALSTTQATLPKFLPRYFTNFEPTSLFSALTLAFFAGLILNLMPCVLPVLSLKIASFMHSTTQNSQSTFRQHNLLFAAGILTWFIFLAIIIGTLNYAWGSLFQSIPLVYSLLLLIFLLSLSLFEVFNLPILDLKLSSTSNPKLQAYLTGLMATLLATPCSGPLLGGVLGFATLTPLPITLLIFICLGFGMATPYLLLAIFPNTARFFPKPGAWTLYLERILGFFLLATTIYLLSILPSQLYLSILIALLIAAMTAWIWGLYSLRLSTPKKSLLATLCLVLIITSSYWALNPTPTQSQWQDYNQTDFLALLGQEPILVEFTAAWCPTCKVLEQTVLTPTNLQELRNQYKLRLIKVDLTQSNPSTEAFLRSLGSVSIPLTAIFPKGVLSKSPIILRDIYTLNQLQQALSKTLGQ